jgi:biopolymer transport protein ExbD
MRINLGEDEQPEIGLIALIDCIFFLLMFFMVATSFTQAAGEKPQKELPVILPTAQMSLDRVGAGAPPLTIGVDKKGKLYLEGNRVSVQYLHYRLM